MSSMPFTGERFTPECVREIWYEHMHRYVFARGLAGGRRVLDAACGEGYGAALLAPVARSVLGLDRSAEAIGHARARYGASHPNVEFREAELTTLALPAESFDLIACFETLEHLEAHDALLAGFARALARDGVALVSTPDRRTYSELSGYRNEHHVRELYRDEFEALVARHFPARVLLGQKLLFQSAIWDAARGGRWSAATMGRDGAFEPTLDYAPVYYVAACAHHPGPLEALRGSLDLFGDAVESVYAHYDEEVRRGVQAGRRIRELEAELARMRAVLAMRPPPS